MKRLFCFFAVLSLCLPFAAAAQESDGGNAGSDTGAANVAVQGTYERAVIEAVTSGNQTTTTTGQQVDVYRVRFLSGPFNGQTKEISSAVGSNPYGLQPVAGDTVVIYLLPGQNGELDLYLEGYDRRTAMLWLVILFVGTLVFLSGWQGLKVAISIGISIALIGYVLIPLFLRGINPVPIAIVLGGVLALISTGMSTGFNKKSYVTAIGTVGGMLMAYVISQIFSNWSHLNGLSTDEDRLFFEKNPLLDPRGLLFAGVIIASLGVVEDVAVSIASGVAEVKRASPRAHFRQLFESGMVIGNDHMGALANTLVFAFVGGSLSTLLLYTQFGGSWLKFINFDNVVDEVIRSLSGTIGLVFTVPITALLAAWTMSGRKLVRHAAEAHEGHEHADGHVH